MLQGLHHQWDCVAQEVKKAKKELEWINNWDRDLLDQIADARDEICRMEQMLKQLKAEKERLEASGLGHRSGHAGPVASCSVPGHTLPKGTLVAKAPKKKGKHEPLSQI